MLDEPLKKAPGSKFYKGRCDECGDPIRIKGVDRVYKKHYCYDCSGEREVRMVASDLRRAMPSEPGEQYEFLAEGRDNNR